MSLEQMTSSRTSKGTDCQTPQRSTILIESCRVPFDETPSLFDSEFSICDMFCIANIFLAQIFVDVLLRGTNFTDGYVAMFIDVLLLAEYHLAGKVPSKVRPRLPLLVLSAFSPTALSVDSPLLRKFYNSLCSVAGS